MSRTPEQAVAELAELARAAEGQADALGQLRALARRRDEEHARVLGDVRSLLEDLLEVASVGDRAFMQGVALELQAAVGEQPARWYIAAHSETARGIVSFAPSLDEQCTLPASVRREVLSAFGRHARQLVAGLLRVAAAHVVDLVEARDGVAAARELLAKPDVPEAPRVLPPAQVRFFLAATTPDLMQLTVFDPRSRVGDAPNVVNVMRGEVRLDAGAGDQDHRQARGVPFTWTFDSWAEAREHLLSVCSTMPRVDVRIFDTSGRMRSTSWIPGDALGALALGDEGGS